MPPIEGIFIIIVVACVLLAIVASTRVLREHEGVWRSATQLAFLWRVPLIGPLITIYLLRKEFPIGSGTYSNTYSDACGGSGEGGH